MKHVYLDHAATTPLDERVLAAMLPYLREVHANPASLHRLGRDARRAVETAREQVARAIGAEAREIVFASGATEATNHALRAAAERSPGCHIVTSALEHAAVLATCRVLERAGHPVSYLQPNDRGEIPPDAVRAALRPDTRIVALMLVNNETGVITDVRSAADAARASGALVFCDAVQAIGSIPVDVDALGVDLMTASAHKFRGPKGVGALYIRSGTELAPFIVGGEQERGLRAGTLNTPAIVGMGAALELAEAERPDASERTRSLRDDLERRLLAEGGVSVNGGSAPRGPKHLNVRFDGVDGEALLMNLDAEGIYVSAGSACSAGTLQASHVLLAMGLTPDEARASVRFSFGPDVHPDDLPHVLKSVRAAAARSRRAPSLPAR